MPRRIVLLLSSMAVWVLVGIGLATLLSVGVLGSEQSVSAQVATADPVFVGAGDIASCTSKWDEATADLLDTIPGTVYTTGDNAYESGTASEFANCYAPAGVARRSWRERILP